MSETEHPHAHALSQRCSARSKRSGLRCRRTAIASSVCSVHGGAAKQVKAKAERTLALWEAEQSQPATVVERRSPETILLDLLHDGDVTLAKIKSELAEGGASGPLIGIWGEWLDRVSKLSRLIIDSGIEQRLLDIEETKLNHAARNQADMVQGLLIHTLRNAPLTAAERLRIWTGLYESMREILQQQVNVRVDGEQVQAFSRQLAEEAAAAEAQAIEAADLAWCGRCGEPIPGTDAPGHCEDCTELEAAADDVEDDDLELTDNVSLLWPEPAA
jgi:hypothetical protein